MKRIGPVLTLLLLLGGFLATAVPGLRGVAFDQEDFKEAKKQAEQGDREGELALGIMYASGQGVPQNYAEALTWYRRAADHGHPIAQNNLGLMYLKGQGIPENTREGARWVRKAADQGYAAAQINMGALSVRGTGVAKNYADALFWFRKAADQGDSEAERTMGRILYEGQIARADYIEAYKWLSLAAAQGDKDALTARDEVAEKMTPQNISKAQALAAAFVPHKEFEGNLPKGSGTGFFVTSDGYLVTAGHVVDGAARIVVKTKDAVFGAALVKMDKDNDLALLKIVGALMPTALTNRNESRLWKFNGKFTPLPIVDSTPLKLGESVSTLGFPNIPIQGFEPKFTRGEINSVKGFRDDPRYFQISAAIQPGNSGGPLLDRSGNVVGTVQATLGGLNTLLATGTMPQNVNYALKSSVLLQFLKSVPVVMSNLTPPRGLDDQSKTADWVPDAEKSVAVVVVF